MTIAYHWLDALTMVSFDDCHILIALLFRVTGYYLSIVDSVKHSWVIDVYAIDLTLIRLFHLVGCMY